MDLTPKKIGNNRQLFLDNFWVDNSKGLNRFLHTPDKKNVSISSDNPWEITFSAYNLVLHTGSIWRMYYLCSDYSGEDMLKAPGYSHRDFAQYCAIAESENGIDWIKPDVGTVEFNGSLRNNLVYTGPHTEFAPFIDTNPDASEDERYKAFAVSDRAQPGKRGLIPLISADGLKWKAVSETPVITGGPFDSHNLPFWDEFRGEYVLYARGVGNADGSKVYNDNTRTFEDTNIKAEYKSQDDLVNFAQPQAIHVLLQYCFALIV